MKAISSFFFLPVNSLAYLYLYPLYYFSYIKMDKASLFLEKSNSYTYALDSVFSHLLKILLLQLSFLSCVITFFLCWIDQSLLFYSKSDPLPRHELLNFYLFLSLLFGFCISTTLRFPVSSHPSPHHFAAYHASFSSQLDDNYSATIS